MGIENQIDNFVRLCRSAQLANVLKKGSEKYNSTVFSAIKRNKFEAIKQVYLR
jgi:hypothetical protein